MKNVFKVLLGVAACCLVMGQAEARFALKVVSYPEQDKIGKYIGKKYREQVGGMSEFIL